MGSGRIRTTEALYVCTKEEIGMAERFKDYVFEHDDGLGLISRC